MSDLTQPPHVPSCVSTGAGVMVPDATATPRTIEQAAQECLTDLECNNYGFAEASTVIAATIREVVKRELTAAKAEICELNAWKTGKKGIEDHYREVGELQSDNAALRAEVERLKTDNDTLRATFNLNPSAAYSQIDQLRAEVERLQSNLNALLADTSHANCVAEVEGLRGAAINGAGAQCLAELRATLLTREGELDAMSAALAAAKEDKERLDWLDMHISTQETADILGLDYSKCHLIRAAIDAARAGKEKCPDGQCVKHRNINGGCDLCGAPSL